MKTIIRKTTLTSIAILFLLGGTTAAFADSPKTLNGTMTGSVTNLGAQFYSVSGGQVVYAYIGGNPVDPNSATIQYNLQASQTGLTTSGSANVQFSATVGGMPVSFSGEFSVNAIDAGAGLPANCVNPVTSDYSTCQTVLPFDFVASSSSVQESAFGSTSTVPLALAIESPYWNPWGGPIYLVSSDMSIVIAATYTQGTILWTGSQTAGTITGTLGPHSVSGSFTQTSNEFENLVTGVTQDTGNIRYSSMTPSSLNTQGNYSGTSTIPTTGSYDCSAPMLPGTCTVTGFHSWGSFRMGGITGTYDCQWGIPAYGFFSTVSASVSKGR